MGRLRILVLLVVVAGLLAQGAFVSADPGGRAAFAGGGSAQRDTPDDPGFP